MIVRACTLGLLLLAGLNPAGAQPQQLGKDPTGSTAPAPRVFIPRDGCVTAECHPGVKAYAQLHGPVRANTCDGCHRLTDAESHKFQPVRGKHDLCTLCHASETLPGRSCTPRTQRASA